MHTRNIIIIDSMFCLVTYYMLTVSVTRRRVARFMSFAIYITFFYLFWKLGDPFPILSAKHGMI